MTSRERVLAVFRREIPDRVPMWCGASPEFMAKSRAFLGVEDDEAVYQRFHDDFRRVYSRYAGPEKFDPVKNAAIGSRLNVFGVERKGEGYGVPANTPLKDATLEDVENYPWPSADWIDVSHIREDALRYGGEYAIMGGEWCPFFHDLLDLLGMEDALVMMYEEPEVVHAVLDHLVDYYYACNQRIFEAAGDVIDIAFMGNDMGSQNGPLVSVKLFDEFFCTSVPKAVRPGPQLWTIHANALLRWLPAADFQYASVRHRRCAEPSAGKSRDAASQPQNKLRRSDDL